MAPPFCKTARSKGAKAEATLIRDTISLPFHLKIPQFLLFIINLESGVSCINKILRGAVATRTPLSSPVAIPSSSNKLVINLKKKIAFFSLYHYTLLTVKGLPLDFVLLNCAGSSPRYM